MLSRKNFNKALKNLEKHNSFMASSNSDSQSAQMTQSLKTPEADKPGGKGVFDRLKSITKGAANFARDAALDLKNTTVDTYQGLGDVGRGVRATKDLSDNTNKLNERNKEWREKFGSASDAQWKDSKFQAEAKKFSEETKKLTTVSANTKQDMESLNKIDAKKLAFQSAETALNFIPGAGALGGKIAKTAVKTLAKDAIKQAIKTGGAEAIEQLVKEGGERATKEIVKQGGKKLLTKAGEGALFGAAYGATTTGKNNPDASGLDFAKGAAIGGALGGALPVAFDGLGKGINKIKGSAPGQATSKVSQDIATQADEVVQIVNPKTGDKTFFRIPSDQRDDIVNAIDNERNAIGKGGTAGKSVAGEVTHVTARTPESMLSKGFKDGGVYGATAPNQVDAIKTTGIKAKVNAIFQPVNNLGEETQTTFKKNAGDRNVAEIRGKSVEKNLQKAADEANVKLDMNLAHQIEAGTAADNAFTQQFRSIADKTRQEAVDAGLDIGYREDYVPHMWKQAPEAVDKMARGAGLKPQAGFKRVIPTYEEGIALGLKPKYKNPAEMMGAYVKSLETTRTNVALMTDLKQQGLMKSGRPPAGWATIAAEGFPRTAQGNQLSAPKEVATILNNIYGKSDSIIEKGLSKTASFNSKWQDIALAGGVPGTPANFFTFSQMMKEASLGVGQIVTGAPIKGAKTVYSPVAAFARSFSTKQTDKVFAANSGFVESMAKRGVEITPSSDGGVWNKLFNEPTFGRFMPNLQLNTAKNVQNALEKKLGKDAALDLTAETMKKMYGITDQLATGRSQGVQDAIGTIAFAPKYREGIINVLAHTLKAVGDPRTYGDRSYALNRRLAVGIGATYMIYDQINKQTTGHGMHKNPEGKELTLAIPYGGKDDKGNQKVAYIPFMPGFLTIPRAGIGAVKGAITGDTDAVLSEGGKFLSMPIMTGSQLAANKDYFGRPIVIDAAAARATRTEEDSNLGKLKKRALYLAGQSTPAAVRAGISASQGKPMEQNLAQAAEAPLRFGTQSPKSTRDASFSPGQVTGDFYDAYNPLSAKRSVASKEITYLVKNRRRNEAKRKAEEFNASLNGKFGKYYKKYGDNPTDDPMWDEMLNGLFFNTTKRSFDAREKQ